MPPPLPRSSREKLKRAKAHLPTTEQLIEPLAGGMEPVAVSAGYRFMSVLTAIAMVLLPVTYFGVCVLLVWGMFAFGRFGFAALGNEPNPWLVFLVVMPLVMMALVLGLMIRPWFASAESGGTEVEITPENQPTFFKFLEALCRAIGAPMPRRVFVNMEVNAMASLGRGGAMAVNRDLRLHFGLPLVSGLTFREFAGVLAHELGHFTQNAGMRSTLIVRSINAKLGRMVYERDALDERLDRWQSKDVNVALLTFAYLVRMCLWLSRRMMWVWMILGHTISCFMLRQMELHADRYEARIAGSKSFERVVLKLAELSIAQSISLDDLSDSWRERRLGDDLPVLVIVNSERMGKKPEIRARVKQLVRWEQTDFLSTHPSGRTRYENIRNESAEGMLPFDFPAGEVFAHYRKLCRVTSLSFYRSALGDEVADANLMPTELLVDQQNREKAAGEALLRYFQGKLLGQYALFLGRGNLAELQSPEQRVRDLHQARRQMLERIDSINDQVERLSNAVESKRNAAVATSLLNAGVSFNAKKLGLAYADWETAHTVEVNAEFERADALKALGPFIKLSRVRLFAALELLQSPRIRKRIEHGRDQLEEVNRMLRVLRVVEQVWPSVRMLRDDFFSFVVMLNGIGAMKNADALAANRFMEELMALSARVTGHLGAIQGKLAEATYPFPHAEGDVTVARVVIEKAPKEDDLGDVYAIAVDTLESVTMVYYRIMAVLTEAGESVETILGMKRLELPEDADEDDPLDVDYGGHSLPTNAANPGDLRPNPIVYSMHYPVMPLSVALPAVTFIGAAALVHWAFIVGAVASVAVGVILWRGVRRHYRLGNAVPGIVISVEPVLIAFYTDLTHGKGNYPVLKVIQSDIRKASGRPIQIGARAMGVAMYSMRGSAEQGFWDDFDPRPIDAVTENRFQIERLVASIPEKQWKAVRDLLSQLPEPYGPGLYRVTAKKSDWTAEQLKV